MGERAGEVTRAARGRTGAATTPVVIRGAIARDLTLTAAEVRRALGAKLGKFAWRLDRVDVALSSRTPAKGAAEAQITITLRVARAEPVVATGDGRNVRAAFAQALRATERALRRGLERKRRAALRVRRAREG